MDHFWPEDKATWLEELMLRMGFRRDEAVAVGDSWLDVPMFRVVGLSVDRRTDEARSWSERLSYE